MDRELHRERRPAAFVWHFMWSCLAVLAVCLCAVRASRITMDDDNLYLAYAAQSDVARATPLEQSLIDRIAAVPGCEESVYRLALRKRYLTNYAGYSAVQRAVQNAASSFVPSGPKLIVVATLVTKALFLLVLVVGVALVVRRTPSRELQAAVICSFIALVALDFGTGQLPKFMRVDITALPHTILQQLSSFFVIARAHSYFDVTPRNGALLMFVIALLLKWQGHLTSAVVAILLIAPLHQIYGGMGLVLFAVASALSRPDIFSTRSRRAILVAAGLSYVGREHLPAHLDVWAQVAAALGLVLAALLFFRGVCSARYAAFRERCLGSWAGREIALDVAALLVCVTLSTLLSWVGNRLLPNAITRPYVWEPLPLRTLSFVRFPAFIAGFWLVLKRTRWLASERGRIGFSAVCALSCVVLSWVCAADVDTRAVARLRSDIERSLRRPGNRIFEPHSEEKRTYAYLTLVAAGQVEPAAADANIVADREIRCSHH